MQYQRNRMAKLSDSQCKNWYRFLSVEEPSGKRTFTAQQFWLGLQAKDSDPDIEKRKEILTLFQLQESTVLNQGSDKTERFRQLHERIVVLRGAVFSGFALFLICLFGCIAPVQGQPSSLKSSVSAILLAPLFLVFVIPNRLMHLK